ncbi:MAG: hypothetical protein ACFFFG_06220 [Candidatus Thorarchaeota archaeon]
MRNRELWYISGIILDETYFQAQLTAAGGQRARILERFEKGQGSMKRVAFLNMIIVSFFLLSLTIIPISALGTASQVMVDSENIYNVAFILSFGVASYYVSSFIILLVFGLFQLIELVHGENFALTATLPLTRSDLSRLGIFVYMRLYWGQFIVLLLAFPLASLMITGSQLFPVILLANSINVVFMFYGLVLVAHFVGGRIFKSEVTSKIRTITRILFVLFYMLIIFNISGLFAAIPTFLVDLYGRELFFDPVLGELVNLTLSLIIFPFSGGFLITVTFFLSIFFNYGIGLVLSTVIGFLGLVAATSLVTRKGNQVLQKLGRFDNLLGSHGEREVTSIQIKSSHPVVGYIRVSLVLATRNYSGLFALLSPLVFAVLILATGFSFSGFSRTLDPFSVILIYSGFLPLIMRNGIFATEESLGGLLSSLPISQREIFRARQILLSMILNTSIPVIWVFQSLAGGSLFLSSGFSVIFVNIIATTGFLFCHSLLFGKMNKQFTVFTVSTKHTVLKNFLLVILTNGIILLGLLWAGFVSTILKRTISGFSMAGALLGYLSLLILSEFMIRRMFPLPD